jgi:hypothetical protein
MDALFASGRVVDLILAFMVLEGAVVAVFRRLTGRGPSAADIAFTLVPGIGLLLAWRAAAAAAWWGWIALCLLLALIAHLADLRARWRR